jgi:glycosyltransferase involved in cell wall biosynthesis
VKFQVVVHTPDVIGEQMAGPGIRALHLASELARNVPTTLIAQLVENVAPASAGENVAPASAGERELNLVDRGSPEAQQALRDAAVLIGQPSRGFVKRRREQRIVYDLFDPTVLELRELYGSAPSIRQRVHLAAEWGRLCRALTLADLLMAAGPRQRQFYDRLRVTDAEWIDVPFGVDLGESRVCEKPKDNLVVWGGGTWEWLDPALAVDAVVQLNREGLRTRLLFLGRSRPNRDLVDRRREDRFDGLLARGRPFVDANNGWVPYAERLAWLRAGKVAIMLHRPTAEAEYSIRTRLFDAIVAAVPVVATRGGFAAELVEQEGLGLVVPPSDQGAVAAAIRRLLEDDVFYATCVQHLERVRPRFAWERVTEPLVGAVLKWQKQFRA